MNFGWALATGDLDADGTQDIVVTAPLRFNAYIFRTQNSSGTLSIGTTAVPVPHPSSNVTFGTGICVGNSDGVGADDLFIATPTENCSVACGGVTGTGNLLVYENASTAGVFIAPSSVSYRISPSASLQGQGYSLTNTEVVVRSCTLGSFDASSPAETQLVIGSGTVSIAAGVGADVMIAFYRRTGASTFTFQNALPATAPTVTGNNWGQSVAAIQLDTGVKELLVGAPLYDNVGTDAGAVFLYTVTSSGAKFSLTDTGQAFYGGTDFDNNGAGSSIAAGDIWNHGNGVQDMVMGASLDDGTMTLGASAINLGQAFTFRNVSGTVDPSANQSAFSTATRGEATRKPRTGSCHSFDRPSRGIESSVLGIVTRKDFMPSSWR